MSKSLPTKAKAVFEMVKKIPAGRVMTYGQIAKLVGFINPRLVGRILHQNPDPQSIPCYRVVNSQGKLSPSFAFGGLSAQQEKLEQEGIKIVNHMVNLDRVRVF